MERVKRNLLLWLLLPVMLLSCGKDDEDKKSFSGDYAWSGYVSRQSLGDGSTFSGVIVVLYSFEKSGKVDAYVSLEGRVFSGWDVILGESLSVPATKVGTGTYTLSGGGSVIYTTCASGDQSYFVNFSILENGAKLQNRSNSEMVLEKL